MARDAVSPHVGLTVSCNLKWGKMLLWLSHCSGAGCYKGFKNIDFKNTERVIPNKCSRALHIWNILSEFILNLRVPECFCVHGFGLAGGFFIHLYPGWIVYSRTEWLPYGPTLLSFVGPLDWNHLIREVHRHRNLANVKTRNISMCTYIWSEWIYSCLN